MAVSQKGASYQNRAHIRGRDQLLGDALDDIASQVQAVGSQTNADVSGRTQNPHPPTALRVVNSAGFAQVAITHNSPPKGTAYLLEYSITPNFQNPQQIDNGISLSFEKYLHGKTLYWRVASTFYTSEPSPWVYFGSPDSPTPVTF